MSYYYESIDLDLKKNLTSLQYDEIVDEQLWEQVQVLNETHSSDQGQQLIVESQILLNDVKNLCTYFHQKYFNQQSKQQFENLQKFPFEKVKNRFCHILAKYQEQSSLLDSLLENLVGPLANIIKLYVHKIVYENLKSDVKEQLNLIEEFHTLTDSLYNIGKVRGVRHISKYFPHEVRDLEPVVYVLQRSVDSVDRNAHWETKYVLLLWLSVIVLVPFDLSSIDSNLFVGIPEELKSSEDLQGSILLCLVNLGVHYLRSSTKLRNASALFLSKLFSRPDVLKSSLLKDFIRWSVKTVQQLDEDVLHAFFVTGVLETLVEILKSGQRSELRTYLIELVPLIQQNRKGNSLINLFVTKLSQRVGLVYLRPRLVNWAYQKGNQNLAGTLQNNIDYTKIVTNAKINITEHQGETQSNILEDEIVDYFADVDQTALELVIDNLLIGLTNKDTIVRWSAAKGIGRICSRLELEQADDIFTALLDTCFTPVQGDTAWHGGCLALGELCRRGLILQHRLGQVIPIVCKALVFEQNQGGYSVGVNVRDSACYVAWSAARAYDPSVLLQYIPQLSQSLAVVMLFDREVNVRRAASSTFQEMVGRCPNVIPHGIEILSESDYFALALRHNAFLKVAPFVASFYEYYSPLVDHLAFVKIQSQDKEVRKLGSKSLSRLAQINIDYIIQNRVIEGLLEMISSPSINAKHGVLYAIGDLLVAISGKTDSSWEEKDLKDSVFLRTLTKNDRELAKAGEHISKFKSNFNQLLKISNLHKLTPEISKRILTVPLLIDQQKLLRGKAGELLRVAVCRLIECISVAKLQLDATNHQQYLILIEDCLKNPLEESQDSAVKALAVLSESYHQQYESAGVKFLQNILKDLNSSNKLLNKSGLAQSIGAFSANIILQQSSEVIITLCKVGLSTKKTNSHTSTSLDPDTRKYAIKSLGLALSKLLEIEPNLSQNIFHTGLLCLLNSMQDYTMNKRGDVGLYIRENAIISTQQVLSQYVKSSTKLDFIDRDLTQKIIGSLLQQLIEKIDRVRLVAGSILQDMFKNVFPKLPQFENYDIISQVFSTSNLQNALSEDQGKVDQSFQSEVIEAEIKQLKQILAHMRESELVYHWNLPHCCYRLIVPLISASNLSYFLVKGLCVSVGGISESVQKYSLEALNTYLQSNLSLALPLILSNSIEIMKIHIKDERILNPLYKTLTFILEREDVQNHPSSKQYSKKLFELIRTETKQSEAIKKVYESVPLIIQLLQIDTEEIGKQCFECIQEYLTCDLPIVRKLTADKFYLFLMSYEDEEILSMEKNLNLQDYLLEVDWLANEFDRQITKCQLDDYFNLESIQQ